jgi:2-methylisocitrate lyase-like PEP mutase family enzyme
MSRADDADKLRQLHHGPGLLVLPNVWDAASARAVEAAGFPVVATSSHAVAAALGFEDHDSMPVDEAFAAVARVAGAVGVPVTADIEAGYGLAPAELVERLVGAGAVGCNLEDTDHVAGGLVDTAKQADFLAAVKEAGRAAGVDIVVNARVDVAADAVDDGIERALAYLAAGADCVYPIRLADDGLIARFVEAVGAPVNVMVSPLAPPLARLQELGVARASLAGGLFRVAQKAIAAHLDGLRPGPDRA